jgi:hypothetical protein
VKKYLLPVAVLATVLSACGGGGGGGGSTIGGGGGPPAPPSVSGDMLALQSNRGWNYQGTNGGVAITVSTYVNPTRTSSGQIVFGGAALPGLVPTVLSSHSTAESNLLGGLIFTQSSAGYNVTGEISSGSVALVPNSPLLVGSTLTQGAVSTPYPGVTETVVSVGSVPGASACPAPGTGATVQYAFQGSTYTLSFVPGCGITQFIFPTGATLTLTSVSSYNIGDLAKLRKVESVTWAETARSLLGLERNDDFAGGAVFGKFLK